jgi:hypothetical protein
VSNQVNHRRVRNAKNKRQDERPTFASGCSGEGHNGQIGRSKWKRLSRRSERHALKQGRVPSGKASKCVKKTYRVKPHSTMCGGFEVTDDGKRRKTRVSKPPIPDTGEY